MSSSDVPICPTCSKPAAASTTRYGVRHSCCGLWSWGGKPLVDEATHVARKAAHAAFDTLWQRGVYRRGDAYKALADALKMTPAECHIAQMTKEDAERVVAIVPHLRATAPRHRLKKIGPRFIGLNPW